jgi:type I restriction enzyme S subunit
MKDGWQPKRLGDVATLQRGFDLPRRNRVSGEFPLVSSSGIIDTHNEGRVTGPGVATGRSGSIGNVFYVESDFWPLNTVLYVKDFHGNDPRFVLHLLRKFDLGRFKSGVGVPTLNRNFVHDEIVSVPPLAEQQRIVGILDEAFEGIATAKANAEKNLQNAHALFESHLHAVFTQRGDGWVEFNLADAVQTLHQGLNTAGQKVKFYESGYPIIQTRNIDDGVVELDTKIKLMCEEDWLLYKDKYRPAVGDVFFTNIGTIGKTAIVAVDRDYLIHWNIFKLRPHHETITSAFLKYTLDHLTSSGYFKKLQKGGTVDFVTKKMISEALVYLPDTAEQTEIVAKLDSLSAETQRLATIYERKLAALDDLKKSLLHQAFSGEL